MKKAISMAILGMALLIFNIPSAQAAGPICWFGAGQNDCVLGQTTCDSNFKNVQKCLYNGLTGCFEWSLCTNDLLYLIPHGQTQNPCQTCDYRCVNNPISTGSHATCISPITCDNGQGCFLGQHKCGIQGTWNDGVTARQVSFECVQDPVSGCYLFGTGGIGADPEECVYGCDTSSGQCKTASQIACARDNCGQKGEYKCIDNSNLDICIPDSTGCLALSRNPSLYKPCSGGCSKTTNACLDDKGSLIRDDCIWGSYQCVPTDVAGEIYKDYTQPCNAIKSGGGNTWNWNISSWNPCPGRCNSGICQAVLPDDVLNQTIGRDACSEGESRCKGPNAVTHCEFDPVQQSWIWSPTTKNCNYGCKGTDCVQPTVLGNRITLDNNFNITRPLQGLAIDSVNGRIFVYGKNVTGQDDISIFVTNFTFARYLHLPYTNENPASNYLGTLAYDGALLWSVNESASSNPTSVDTIYGFDMNGAIQKGPFVISRRNSTITDINGIDVDENYLYMIRNQAYPNCTQQNGYGIHVYNKATGAWVKRYDLVTEGSPTICASGFHQGLAINKQDNSIYVMFYEQTSGIVWLQRYNKDNGYYYGRTYINVTPMNTNVPYNTYLDIKISNNVLYILEAYGGNTNTAGLWSGASTILEMIQFSSICTQECFPNEGRCVGNFQVNQCIKTKEGCYKWYQGDWQCSNPGDSDCGAWANDNCGSGTCTEEYVNHKIKVAYCANSTACPDVCKLGEKKCDAEGGSYWTNCTLKSAFGEAGSYNPLEVLTSLRQILENQKCKSWSSQWYPCGIYEQCKNGNCVPLSTNECLIDPVTGINETMCWTPTKDDVLKTLDRFKELRNRGIVNSQYLQLIQPGNSYVVTCRQTPWSGQYGVWDYYNLSYCEEGCRGNNTVTTFNSTVNYREAQCNPVSLAGVGVRSYVKEWGIWFNILLPDIASKALFGIILMVIISCAGLFLAGEQAGLAMASMSMLVFSIVGLFPFELIFIAILLAGFVLYNKLKPAAGD